MTRPQTLADSKQATGCGLGDMWPGVLALVVLVRAPLHCNPVKPALGSCSIMQLHLRLSVFVHVYRALTQILLVVDMTGIPGVRRRCSSKHCVPVVWQPQENAWTNLQAGMQALACQVSNTYAVNRLGYLVATHQLHLLPLTCRSSNFVV
jgi:hypothetical protein